ncbi:hypothetical protein MACH09_39060 [Vibrio sp. MACH09]|nr:hypothetical protein MACH09_39060 [Vibrio sp. MACH09]
MYLFKLPNNQNRFWLLGSLSQFDLYMLAKVFGAGIGGNNEIQYDSRAHRFIYFFVLYGDFYRFSDDFIV